jgi:hypothetical protein
VERVVHAQRGRLRLCYARALESNPSLAGTVTVRIVVRRDGTVMSVSGSGDVADREVIACITRQVSAMQFPRSLGTSRLTLPFRLGV